MTLRRALGTVLLPLAEWSDDRLLRHGSQRFCDWCGWLYLWLDGWCEA